MSLDSKQYNFRTFFLYWDRENHIDYIKKNDYVGWI